MREDPTKPELVKLQVLTDCSYVQTDPTTGTKEYVGIIKTAWIRLSEISLIEEFKNGICYSMGKQPLYKLFFKDLRTYEVVAEDGLNKILSSIPTI